MRAVSAWQLSMELLSRCRDFKFGWSFKASVRRVKPLVLSMLWLRSRWIREVLSIRA